MESGETRLVVQANDQNWWWYAPVGCGGLESVHAFQVAKGEQIIRE